MHLAVVLFTAFGNLIFLISSILLFRARRKLGRTLDCVVIAAEEVQLAIKRLEGEVAE